jgi:predicted alpha/beta-fold hydrolase
LNLQSKNLVFRPSLISMNWLFGGNVQTILNEIIELFYGEIKYTKRESFVLSDGGTIFVDFMGKCF